MKRLLILLTFCMFSTQVFCQSFYVVAGSGIRKVTIKSGVVTEQAVTSCTSLGSIAINRNRFYYLFGSTLFVADLNNTSITNCKAVGTFVSSNSLTCDINGMLYATLSGNQLVRFNPADKSITNLGTMPYTSAGDLVFYKGDLYMAALNGIVKINMADPSKSTLVIPNLTNIYGLATVPFNSTQNIVYAFINGSPTTIVELDLEKNVVGKTVGTLPYGVGDAASTVENGLLISLIINDIKIIPDCPYTGKGTVQVICKDPPDDITYTLNGVTNTTGIFTGVDPGTYNIKVTSGTESQVTTASAASFVPPDKPVLKTSSINPVCVDPGKITIATDKDGSLYNIQYQGKLYAFNHTFTSLKAGTYHFDILNSNSCIVDKTDIVLTDDACNILVNDITITEECKDPDKGNVQVTATSGTDTYTYSINSIINSTGIFDKLNKGTYTLNITSLGGGNINLPVTIPNYRLTNPAVTYTTRDAICTVTGSIKFSLSVNSTGYTIFHNATTYPFEHTFAGLMDGTYDFTILKPDGCVLDNLTVPLLKEPCETAFFPNTFSPNNDGINDVFRPSQNFKADNFKFFIYNRLGALLFTSDSAHYGWDGQFNGQAVPAGVYFWKASYINNEGKPFLKSGYITLIR